MSTIASEEIQFFWNRWEFFKVNWESAPGPTRQSVPHAGIDSTLTLNPITCFFFSFASLLWFFFEMGFGSLLSALAVNVIWKRRDGFTWMLTPDEATDICHKTARIIWILPQWWMGGNLTEIILWLSRCWCRLNLGPPPRPLAPLPN